MKNECIKQKKKKYFLYIRYKVYYKNVYIT